MALHVVAEFGWEDLSGNQLDGYTERSTDVNSVAMYQLGN